MLWHVVDQVVPDHQRHEAERQAQVVLEQKPVVVLAVKLHSFLHVKFTVFLLLHIHYVEGLENYVLLCDEDSSTFIRNEAVSQPVVEGIRIDFYVEGSDLVVF